MKKIELFYDNVILKFFNSLSIFIGYYFFLKKRLW